MRSELTINNIHNLYLIKERSDYKMTLYMISISSQQKKDTINKQQLQDVITYLKNSIQHFYIQQITFEYGTVYKQLHCHMIVKVKRNFRWKKYTQYGDIQYTKNTFHIDYRKIYNHTKAVQYISKDIPDFNIIQYYKTHFFNISTQRFSVAL